MKETAFYAKKDIILFSMVAHPVLVIATPVPLLLSAFKQPMPTTWRYFRMDPTVEWSKHAPVRV